MVNVMGYETDFKVVFVLSYIVCNEAEILAVSTAIICYGSALKKKVLLHNGIPA